MMRPKVLGMILAGGKGTRLYPLTLHRAKPAVPFGGKYRIIDFVLSNFINSGLYSIYVLTQFKSQSLTEHLQEGWQLGSLFRDHFIIPVPAQMRMGERWYRGTADAIYQNLNLIHNHEPDIVAVFGADHIYCMDIGQMLSYHLEKQAEITVAVLPVPRAEASSFGVVQVDQNWRIVDFWEKPADPPPIPGHPDQALISMGNYLFDTLPLIEEVTEDADRETEHDFGRTILPEVCKYRRVFAYDFRRNTIPGTAKGTRNDYWRDVGTIEAFWEANMELKGANPPLNLYNPRWPIRTVSRSGPPAKFISDPARPRGGIINALVSEGCIIEGALVQDSILGRNVVIHRGAEVRDSFLMDNVEVGEGVRIRKAIIDKRVRIAPGDEIGYDREQDQKRYHVSETGIVVIPRAEGLSL
ncbi:MAG: glucose-1-phosphate adenylyltransferase [Nitrospinota bacterium]|nr:MAG: glucose-1-phosphate adenylyltransferase [Nitrospinota bacterium]